MSCNTSSRAPRASNGTPGSEYSVALCPNLSSGKSNTMIGAVPRRLGITEHVSGTAACARLMSRTSSPLALSILCMISSCLSSVLVPDAPESFPNASFVMSSFVGPRPPVTITMLFSASSASKEDMMALDSSPMDSILVTRMPSELRACDI